MSRFYEASTYFDIILDKLYQHNQYVSEYERRHYYDPLPYYKHSIAGNWRYILQIIPEYKKDFNTNTLHSDYPLKMIRSWNLEEAYIWLRDKINPNFDPRFYSKCSWEETKGFWPEPQAFTYRGKHFFIQKKGSHLYFLFDDNCKLVTTCVLPIDCLLIAACRILRDEMLNAHAAISST